MHLHTLSHCSFRRAFEHFLQSKILMLWNVNWNMKKKDESMSDLPPIKRHWKLSNNNKKRIMYIYSVKCINSEALHHFYSLSSKNYRFTMHSKQCTTKRNIICNQTNTICTTWLIEILFGIFEKRHEYLNSMSKISQYFLDIWKKIGRNSIVVRFFSYLQLFDTFLKYSGYENIELWAILRNSIS